MMSVPRPHRVRGFTLAELLVVIVVLGILAAIAIPVFLSQADRASAAALKSELANAAKLLQVAEANGEALPSEFTSGQVVDLGTAGTFTASQDLTVTGSGESLCVEGMSGSGSTFSHDVTHGLRNYDCAGNENGSAVITDGLLVYLDAGNPQSYPGEGDTWFDLSGNDNHGTLANGVGFDPANKGSLTFDGVNDHVQVDMRLDQLSDNEYTVIAGAKLDSISTSRRHIFSSDSGGHDWSFGAGGRSAGPHFIAFTGSNAVRGSEQDTDWHIFATQWSADIGTRMYLDNTLDATSGVSFDPNVNSVINIGDNPGDWVEYWHGDVAFVLVYDRVLSEAELTQAFTTFKNRYGL